MHPLKPTNLTPISWLLCSIVLINSCTCSSHQPAPQPTPADEPKHQEPNPPGPTIDELIAQLKATIANREKAGTVTDGHKNLLHGLESIKNSSAKPTEKFVYKYPDGGVHKLTLPNLGAHAPGLSSEIRIKLFEYAKAQGGDFKALTPWGESILHLLVKCVDVTSLSWLLQHTNAEELITTKTTDHDKATPLKMAVNTSLNDATQTEAWLKLIALLLNQGAAKDKTAVKALHHECERTTPSTGKRPNRRGANQNGEVAALLQKHL